MGMDTDAAVRASPWWSRTWEPADRQAKAIRALAASRPVYLDEDLLVLRAKPDYIVWAFERV